LASTLLLRAGAGSLDLTFNPGSGANGTINCMAVQTNGQIIIGGNFSTFNGISQNCVARLNSDGSLDGSFGIVQADNAVYAIAVQGDGKILIGGAFSTVNGLSFSQHFARLRYDGSVDTSFNPGLTDSNSPSTQRGYIFAMTVQPDGKVIVGGNWYPGNTNGINVARFATNGTLDATFTANQNTTFSVHAIGLQSTGKVILGLYIGSSSGPLLERVSSDGTLDTNFLASVSGLIASSYTDYSIAMMTNDSFYIGGDFNNVNGYSRIGVARLNADGSIDNSFNPGTGANYTVNCVAVQPDGKVLVGGYFWTFNGVTRNGIVRLNSDGTVDSGFNPGGGVHILNYPNPPILCMAIQQDSKTLIGGAFTSFNGTNINRIARLNSDTSSTTLNLLNANNYFGMYVQGTVSNGYRIEYTSTLNTTNLWTPLFNLTLQTNPQFIYDPTPATGARFYRAVQISP
jgi:hypothetical protein